MFLLVQILLLIPFPIRIQSILFTTDFSWLHFLQLHSLFSYWPHHVSEAPVRYFQAGFYTAFIVLYDNVNYILFRKDVFVFLLLETVNSLELRDHFLSIPSVCGKILAHA